MLSTVPLPFKTGQRSLLHSPGHTYMKKRRLALCQPSWKPPWTRAWNNCTARVYTANIKYLDDWNPSLPPLIFFSPHNSVVTTFLLNLSLDYAYTNVHFLASQSTSKIAVSKQQHIHMAPGRLLWRRCSRVMLMNTLFPDEDPPLQKQAMLLKEPRGYHETAYQTFPPCRTPILVQTLCRKRRDFHQELSVLKDNLTCNSVFPHQLSNSPNLLHSALRSLLSLKANSPGTVTCLRKKCWTWPPISSCLPEAAVPVVSEFPAPLLWCFLGSTQLLLPVHLLMHEGRTWNYPAKARAHNNKWNSRSPLREHFFSEILVSILKRDLSTVSHESWALKGIAFYWMVKGRALWAQGFSST